MTTDPARPDGPTLRTVHHAYSALRRGDLAAFCVLLDDQVEWRHPLGFGPPLGGTHLGPVAVAQNVIRSAHARWAELTHLPESYLSGPGHVLALGRSTYLGPSGNRGSADFAHLWLFDADRVIGVRIFEDTAIAGRYRRAEPDGGAR